MTPSLFLCLSSSEFVPGFLIGFMGLLILDIRHCNGRGFCLACRLADWWEADKPRIETEREVDGRWIAEVMDVPGALAYGATKEEAKKRAVEIAEAVKEPK
jgi:hypothetical protein